MAVPLVFRSVYYKLVGMLGTNALQHRGVRNGACWKHQAIIQLMFLSHVVAEPRDSCGNVVVTSAIAKRFNQATKLFLVALYDL